MAAVAAAADHTGAATAEAVAAVDMAPTLTAVEEWVEVVALVLEDLGAL